MRGSESRFCNEQPVPSRKVKLYHRIQSEIEVWAPSTYTIHEAKLREYMYTNCRIYD